MKSSYYLIAATLILASGACNAKNGDSAAADASASGKEAPVKPPANGDWSQIVRPTSQGGFRMGNPNADVKLVEYGSMTCPHCGAFDESGVGPLTDKYVKGGKVSYEFRNFVRDPFDITASLIARCNGAKSFFPVTRALYKDQKNWIQNIQNASQAQVDALQNLGPEKQFLEIAKLADLQKWGAMRGVPTAKSSKCLTDQNSVNQLVQMNSDATSAYPNFPGTPTFVINGKMVKLGPVTEAQVWPALESKIKAALGG